MVKTVYLNNTFMQEDQAAISPLNNGYLFGEGLFETLRSDRGYPFRLAQHLERLRSGLRKLALPEPPDLNCSAEIIKELLKRNHLSQTPANIKMVVSRDSSPPARTGETPPSSLMIRASALDLAEISRRQQGMRALILPWRRDQHNPLLSLKSLNYLENRYALREARSRGFDEGIFLNQAGELCEGTFSNIFLIQDKTLLTPPLNAGILPGITRDFILESAGRLAIDCRTIPLHPQIIKTCDGAFLTSSLMQIAPLLELDKHAFDLKQTVELRRRLHRTFTEKVLPSHPWG
ncbi:MAG: aminotransferase class IV [Deltaproteobacteria bacterium]|nr:aminotransferase class IV [Deltaproteobacteria bacterium]